MGEISYDFDNRVVIVTGASSGIGREIALKFGTAGADVINADITPMPDEVDLSTPTHRAVDEVGGNGFYVETDLTDTAQTEALVDETVSKHGTIDIIVNNVGVIGSFSRFNGIEDEEWEKVIQTNLLSVVRLTRAAVPHMREQGWGRIVNIASDAAIQPHAEMPHYNASKAAIVNLTKSLSKEYGETGILVNSVSPTTMRTPLVKRMFRNMAEENNITVEEAEQMFLKEEKPELVFDHIGDPESVANVVAFLSSDGASFINGVNYRVDGGAITTIDT